MIGRHKALVTKCIYWEDKFYLLDSLTGPRGNVLWPRGPDERTGGAYEAAAVAAPLKKVNKSALIWSALVAGMPWGKPG